MFGFLVYDWPKSDLEEVINGITVKSYGLSPYLRQNTFAAYLYRYGCTETLRYLQYTRDVGLRGASSVPACSRLWLTERWAGAVCCGRARAPDAILAVWQTAIAVLVCRVPRAACGAPAFFCFQHSLCFGLVDRLL